jgi:chromosome segregation ATPase
MDPVVANTFDEMLKRMDEQDKRSAEHWERPEKRFDDASASLYKREDAIDDHLSSLEGFAHAQYNAAVVADNWGAHFESRVNDLEQRMADLELIRLAEIRDERDDRVEAAEQAVGDLQSWRLELDGYIDDIRYDLHRLNKSHAMQPQQPSLMARRKSAAATLHSGRSPPAQRAPRRNDYTGAGLWIGHDHSAVPGQWYAHSTQLRFSSIQPSSTSTSPPTKSSASHPPPPKSSPPSAT